MFKVKDKDTGEVFTVYTISGTMFLIYDRADNGGTWAYVPMELFEPVEEG